MLMPSFESILKGTRDIIVMCMDLPLYMAIREMLY